MSHCLNHDNDCLMDARNNVGNRGHCDCACDECIADPAPDDAERIAENWMLAMTVTDRRGALSMPMRDSLAALIRDAEQRGAEREREESKLRCTCVSEPEVNIFDPRDCRVHAYEEGIKAGAEREREALRRYPMMTIPCAAHFADWLEGKVRSAEDSSTGGGRLYRKEVIKDE